MSTNTTTKRRPVRNEDLAAEPAISEQLADEVAAEDEEYPDGMPELRSVLQIPRRERSSYYRAADAVNALLRKQGERKAGKTADPESQPAAGDLGQVVKIELAEVADYNELLAGVEDMLAVVAADPDAFRTWSTKVDDSTLIRVFNLYQRKAQPGEAQRSSS